MREQLIYEVDSIQFRKTEDTAYPCCPSLDLVSKVYRTADILSEDGGSKSVRGIISLAGYL